MVSLSKTIATKIRERQGELTEDEVTLVSFTIIKINIFIMLTTVCRREQCDCRGYYNKTYLFSCRFLQRKLICYSWLKWYVSLIPAIKEFLI